MLEKIFSLFNDVFNGNKFWMIQTFIVVLTTGIIYLIEKRVYIHFVKIYQKTTDGYWKKTLIKALNPPLSVFIWLLGISIAADVVAFNTKGVSLLDFTPTIRKVGILISITWFCLRFIRLFECHYLEHVEHQQKTVDKTLVHAVYQLLTVATVITAVLIAMQMLGLPISALLAFGGIGGAGIAFASKDLLANFFGGLVIYLDRPFKVGDWIRSPDRQIEGTVEHIGWRLTTIRTFNLRPLYVPNGLFLTVSVENPSRMSNRRIYTKIGIRYDDALKINEIVNETKEMLLNHPEIDTKKTLMVNFVEFGSSSLNFMIYTFTKTTNWVKFQDVQQDVFLKTVNIIDKHGAQCAFPTQTVHLTKSISSNA